MDWVDELEFINRMGLRDVKPHSKGFNFKCDLCADKKRRGFILIDKMKNFSTYYCHHCSTDTSVKKILELHYPFVYEEYLEKEKSSKIDKAKEGTLFSKKSFKTPAKKEETYNLKLFTLSKRSFVSAETSKECIEYAIKRKIPAKIFKKLKFCINEKLPCYNMLIFPFYFDEERVYGFQGRSLETKMFYNFQKNESFKVYNIFGVNRSDTVYIVESIIDSFQIQNCIAMCGTSLSERVVNMLPYRVYIFDNDVRTKDKKGIHQAIEYAKNKEKVLVWPTSLNDFKDPNDLIVKNNWTNLQLIDMIKNNIKEGIDAIISLKFKLKKQ